MNIRFSLGRTDTLLLSYLIKLQRVNKVFTHSLTHSLYLIINNGRHRYITITATPVMKINPSYLFFKA